jgi:hypothetical protein
VRCSIGAGELPTTALVSLRTFDYDAAVTRGAQLTQDG